MQSQSLAKGSVESTEPCRGSFGFRTILCDETLHVQSASPIPSALLRLVINGDLPDPRARHIKAGHSE